MRPALALILLAVLAPSARAAAPASCGAPAPTEVITGTFTADQTGSFVMLPFDVPRGTTAIRAWYCYDRPPGPLSPTLDFGYYEPGGRYRGWSGSGFFEDITVSPRGFDTTTRGYRPGPIPAGEWSVELGLAAVLDDLDWRVELQIEDDPAFARPRYRKPRYDSRPAVAAPGWYAGDFHVHTHFSGDAKGAPPAEVFDYAFGEAGLDFVQATDHNTDSGWAEFGLLQAEHPGKLIARNTEITTYRGHVNAPGIRRLADYRTGAILRRRDDGSLEPVRDARPVRDLFDDVHAAGGVTTINHPTIFDSSIPGLGVICRGCSWEYDDAETDFTRVDAIEVATGPQGLKLETDPGPNPFTPLALDFYERAQALAGRRIAAVSGSDSHAGGKTSFDDVTGSPVGVPATMVFARELSERGIADAVAAGHTYVRAFGMQSPELRFEAGDAIFGDTVRAAEADFTARVIGTGAGPEPLVLMVTRDGALDHVAPVTSADFTHRFSASAPGRYGLRLMRGSAIEAVGTPITLTEEPAEPLAVRVFAKRLRRGRVRVGCRARGEGLRACRLAVGRRARVVPLYRAGTRRVTLRAPRRRRVIARAVALGDGVRSRPASVRVGRRAGSASSARPGPRG